MPMRGNVDGDIEDIVNISDLTYLTAFMFNEGNPPSCLEEANVDGDAGEEISITDLTYLINYLFSSGPPPPPCQ